MPIYLITKKITSTLVVECDDEAQARVWSDRIVAMLENEDGTVILPETVESFEADCVPMETVIERFEDSTSAPKAA
jgi:hypothetical protein